MSKSKIIVAQSYREELRTLGIEVKILVGGEHAGKALVDPGHLLSAVTLAIRDAARDWNDNLVREVERGYESGYEDGYRDAKDEKD